MLQTKRIYRMALYQAVLNFNAPLAASFDPLISHKTLRHLRDSLEKVLFIEEVEDLSFDTTEFPSLVRIITRTGLGDGIVDTVKFCKDAEIEFRTIVTYRKEA